MMAAAASRIREQHARLSQLDCVAGDGDHGTTMLRTVDRLEKAFGGNTPADLKNIFSEAGWSVLGVDGGASSFAARCVLSGHGEALPQEFRPGIARASPMPSRPAWPQCRHKPRLNPATRP